MHIDSTLADPDVAATLECVSRVLRAHIDPPDATATDRSARASKGTFKECSGGDFEESSARTRHSSLLVFEDSLARGRQTLPSVAEIDAFFRHVYTRSEAYVECIVTALILIERLMLALQTRFGGGASCITPTNWRPIIFSTMMLASKVCDDESPRNADWCNVCAELSLDRVNELETALLKALNYNATVTASTYATYYFQLRSMAAQCGLVDAAAIQPLDVAVAMRISRTSHKYTLFNNSLPRAQLLNQHLKASSAKHSGETALLSCRPSATFEQLVDMSAGQTFRNSRNSPPTAGLPRRLETT